MPYKVLNASLTLAIAVLVVSFGASAGDPVAIKTDSRYGASPPVLILPTPLSHDGSAAADNGVADQAASPPIPTSATPVPDDSPVTVDNGVVDRGESPPMGALPTPVPDDETTANDNDVGDRGEESPIGALPTPVPDDETMADDNDVGDREEEPPIVTLPAPPSDDDSAANSDDVANRGTSSPILTLPTPLFDDDTLVDSNDDNDVANQREPSPIQPLPTPLSDRDESLYRQIFAVQEDGHWRQADRLIAKLDNQLLLGHVLGQRYLHPTRYRSRYSELAKWLRKYADHPEAKRIHELAMKRKPGRAKNPTAPRIRPPIYHGESGNGGHEPILLNGLRHSRHVARIQRQIRRLVRRERLTVAETLLQKNLKRLPAPYSDISRARIAAGWFFLGNDQRAFELADGAAWRSGRVDPFAHWYAGLAAYRMGNASAAAAHFEKMAEMQGISGWYLAGAAFWAARANMVARQPAKVSYWLAKAAEYPRTFYGIIGRRLLGTDSPFRWNQPILEDDIDISAAFSDIRAQRALALIQVEQYYRAETELRQLAKSSSTDTKLALIAIADQVGLPALALRAASSLQDVSGRRIERGLYPVPHWTPKNGFIVDRALIFAIMRQESAFNSRARSGAGARGLMQLMPATASYMAKRRFRGRSRNKLYDPALNMMLGQKYLRYLIHREGVEGNLFMMAVAYNGGPGNLAKWKRRSLSRSEDPLMFIESIPARETRDFVERVLSNLWMYRERLGQAAPSLDAVAAGELPLYKALDPSQVAEAEADGEADTGHGRN